MYDKEIRAALEGQRAIDGSIVEFRSAVGTPGERCFGQGSVEAYFGQLDQVEELSKRVLRSTSFGQGEKLHALSTLKEVERLRHVAADYEVDRQAFAVKRQQLLPFKEETNGKEAGSSRRSESA